MELKQYFDSYRKSVLSDAPKGFVEYARTQPTLKKEFPTFYEYLQFVTETINNNISKNDLQAFNASLRDHQKSLMHLFKKMVREQGDMYDGWKSFKFSNAVIKLDNGVHIVPRTDLAIQGEVCVYASEMAWLSKDKVDTLVAVKKKNGSKLVKLVDGNMVCFGELMNFEGPEVIDWTEKI